MSETLEAIVQTTAIPTHADSGFHDVRNFKQRALVWFKHHRLEFVDSWLKLWLTPSATLLAMCVMSLALAVPAGFYILLENGKNLVLSWPVDTQVSVFVAPEHSDEVGRALISSVSSLEGVSAVEFISKKEALQTFSSQSGLADTILGLDENPLPAVLLVTPQPELTEDMMLRLSNQLSNLEGVDQVRMDADWFRKLRALVDVLQKVLTLMAVALGVTLVFVVLSATQLAIHERSAEIGIKRLFGASEAYIRRPFLYSGFWLGFWSSIFATFLVWSALSWVGDPLKVLLSLYQSEANFHQLDWYHIAFVFSFGIGFSWLGAWLATHRGL